MSCDEPQGADLQAFVEVCQEGYRSFESQRFDEALEAFSKATSLKPDEPQPWEMLACTLANLGRLKEALEAFDRVKELGHECETCRQNRAILLSRLEGDHGFLRYEDLFAGPRVASPSRSASLHLEDTEIAKFDPPLFNQRIQNAPPFRHTSTRSGSSC